MSWLQAHATAISALASAGMLLIWGVYAWLFYQAFRRQRSSKLFIHQAGGTDIRATCLVINLSTEPVHVVRTLVARGEAIVRLRNTTREEDLSVLQRELQGPLGPGQSMSLGSFEQICRELGGAENQDEGENVLEVRIAALHGFKEWPVGAIRAFRVNREREQVVPHKDWTHQLHSRRHSSQIRRWLEM